MTAPQATTQPTTSGAGLTLTPASFAVNGVTYSNAGNGYINTVPVTPSITSSTVTTIASGAYGSITVGATPFNTITLGTAVGFEGNILRFKNIGAGVVTVDGNASETIDGATTTTLSQYQAVSLIAYAGNWYVL